MNKSQFFYLTAAMIWALSTLPACSSKPKKCPPKQPVECSCESGSDSDKAEEMEKPPNNEPIVFEAGKPIVLPTVTTQGGKPLMALLNDRRSSREYSNKPLDRQTLGDLLWAAWGINRNDHEKRTAPSAMNWQEMEIHVVLEQGVFVYDAKNHALVPRIKKDIRVQTGKQPFVGTAPVNLVYVSDLSKMGDASDEKKPIYAGAHAGFVSQNVYLYCASKGLSTVVRAYFDPDVLKEALELKENQFVALAQTVGYPPAS